MDVGKFYGDPEVFNSVMEHMNKDDLIAISRLFQAKAGKITTKEINKDTALGSLNLMLGAEIIDKFKKDHNNCILTDEAVDCFRQVLTTSDEHIRIVLTYTATHGCTGICFLTDDEPLNPSTIFGRLYDNKRKKFKESSSN